MRIINKIIYISAQQLRKMGYNFNESSDARVLVMKKEIKKIGGKIEFNIEQYPDGSWTAESTNIEGILTGGRNSKEITITIKDAIFTFFGIPPQLCNDNLLRGDNEPVTLKQHIYV
jgi:hypothetical protein